jgi:hypothetical protein
MDYKKQDSTNRELNANELHRVSGGNANGTVQGAIRLFFLQNYEECRHKWGCPK